MRTIEALLDEVYTGQERVSRDELHRRAVAAELPADAVMALDSLPEGEYAQDEVLTALSDLDSRLNAPEDGIPGVELGDGDLLRELASLHRTRHETLLHGSTTALQTHSERTAELEQEYLRRYPKRDIDPDRLRSGARARTGQRP